MLNFENFKVGVVHNIWESSGSELLSVKRACVKAKIISGTYTLQADRAKFNGNRTSSLCPLCFKQSEDLMHFIIKCLLIGRSEKEIHYATKKSTK